MFQKRAALLPKTEEGESTEGHPQASKRGCLPQLPPQIERWATTEPQLTAAFAICR